MTKPQCAIASSQRFTLDGSPALENQIAQSCNQVLAEARQLVSARKFQALLLGGGYGRGEGGVLKMESGDQPYNDLEFYIFLRGIPWWNQRRYGAVLHSLGERLSPKAGVAVEFKIISLEKLQNSPPSMFYYDLVMGHRWLWGKEELLAGCAHHRRAELIPLSEAARLLMNRCSGLLFACEKLQREALSVEDTDFIFRNQAKAQLAFGDAVLTAEGQYHWSCRTRHERLLQLKKPWPWLGTFHEPTSRRDERASSPQPSPPEEERGNRRQVHGPNARPKLEVGALHEPIADLAAKERREKEPREPLTPALSPSDGERGKRGQVHGRDARPMLDVEALHRYHREGVTFKLQPQRTALSRGELEIRQRDLTAFGLSLWLWLEERRLNQPFSSAREYALSSFNKCPECPPWRNVLVNFNAFGPARLWRRGLTRNPRERVFNALALLLWEPDVLEDPVLLQHLQSELGAPANTFPDLVHAYRSLWQRFN